LTIGILLAAGRSQRFGPDEKKQFVSLADKPVLVHCLERFESYPQVNQYLVMGPKTDLPKVRSVGKTSSRRDCINVISGGDTRRDSVRIGLEAITEESPDNVIIHDVARPLVPTPVVSRLVERMNSDNVKGVVPALTPDNTIKMATNDNELVEETLDRSALRSVQTPQLFDFETLLTVHRAWSDDNAVTDDAMMLEEEDHPVGFVEGSRLSMKITYPSDRVIVETFLEMEKR
jgi:2-C-methyl-D-erythritol 4-phosphate cytidylyltransferase